jgi:ATP-dependent helicase/nuclease subunit B
MIEFIYGAPQTGKTTLLYEKIKATLTRGGDAVLIVPDQEALDAEAAVVRFCRGTPTLKLRVYGFSRLADDVFRKYGGISYNYVNKTGQTLAMFLAVCSVMPSLKVYGKASPSDGALLSSVLSAVREIKRQGISADELERAANEVSSKSLKDKLYDICLLLPAYETVLKSSGDDPDDETGRMYRVLSENGGMPDTDVYINSFVDFTGTQLKVIELFMRTCRSVTVTFGIPSPASSGDTFDLLSAIYNSEKKLAAAASRSGGFTRTILDKSYASPCMAALEAGLRTGEKSKVAAGDDIRFFRDKTPFDEAEHVAADIRKRLMNGCRCRDIAVITHSAPSQRGIIDAALERYGIPYFISGRDDAKQKALFRLILSALRICTGGFKTKDVLSYVKTGLLSLPSDTLDLFCDYITRREIRGIKAFGDEFYGSPYSYGAPELNDERALTRLQTVNTARAAVITPLIDLYDDLHKCENAKDISKAIVTLLGKIDITSTLDRMIADAKANGDTAEAEETAQLWSVFVSVSTQLCAVCGDLPMNAVQYTNLFETVLSETDIGKIPTSTDQVTVGDAAMIRLHDIKHVYLIGCNEGEFPAAVTDSGLFDDLDRELLSDAGIDLPGTTDAQNERLIYDFYRCATAAKKTVTFSYGICSTSGAEKYPCHMLSDIKRIFGEINTYSGLLPEDIAGSKQSLFEYYAEHKNKKYGAEIRKLLAEDEEWSQKLKMLDTPLINKNEKLKKETAEALIPGALRLSPTRLSAFTGCAFAHCCKYFLKLDGAENVSFNAGEFGSFVHYVLKRLIDDRMAGIIPDDPDEELNGLIDKYVNEYCRFYLHIDPSAEGLGRFRASLKNLKKCTVKAAKDILLELNTGKFKPVATELVLNESAGVPPYTATLENGKKAYLSGVIDRVDAYEHDGKTYIKLVDYKTGEHKFSLSSLYDCDKNVQLFAYMLTVCTSKGRFENPVPAALFYMDTVPSYPTAKDGYDTPKEKSFTRGGIALSDQAVLDALEPGMDKKGGKIYKTTAAHMTFAASDELTAVFDGVKAAIADAASRLCGGDASLTTASEKAPCTVCPYISVCRYTEKKERRRG